MAHRSGDNPAVHESSSADPAGITEPIAHALGVLIVGAAASIGVTIVAVLATGLMAEGHAHSIAHLSLPGLMVLVVVARAVQRVRRRFEPREDAWIRAREVSAFDSHLARVLSIAVPAVWFVGGSAILVRHIPGFHDLFVGVGPWLPLGAALWVVATFAWMDACGDTIAAGVHESDRRFRDYWRNLRPQ